MQRGLRGLYAGAGAVASGATGNFLSNRIDNEVGVDVAQILVGSTVSIGVGGISGPGEMLDEDGFVSETVEFVGYGVTASGWDELFEDLDLGVSVGGGQTRVVDVTTDGGGRGREEEERGQSASETFAADVG